jgi:CBS domain-containing protein
LARAKKVINRFENTNGTKVTRSFGASLSPDKQDDLNRLRTTMVSNLIDHPVFVNSEATLSKIIGVLKENRSYEIFITVKNKIAALNLRDIIGITDVSSTKPSLLGKIIPTLNTESTIGEAARIMSLYRIRTLPVVEGRNKITGQVSSKQIVKLMNGFFRENKIRIKASDVMTSNPIVISRDDTAASAKAIMKKRRIDHLPVVDHDNLTGIVTSEDIMELMLPSERIGKNSLGVVNEARLHLAISGIVNKDVVTADVQDSVQSVCDKMLISDSSYCIVKLWDEVQGIITYRDIVSLLGEKIREEIPVYIIGLPDDPLDAELAKSKFANLVMLLRKIYPDILEARCRIKLKDVRGTRKRYEVDAHIITTHGNTTYTANGYDLARIYDELSDALKKKISHKPVRKQTLPSRAIPPPESY